MNIVMFSESSKKIKKSHRIHSSVYPRILLVEDQCIIAKLHRKWLERLNCYVDVAESGQMALNYIYNENPYDLIFMDIGLPDMDGIRVCETIRQYFQINDIPIVALTTHCDDIKEKCYKAGMNDFLSKPTTHQILQKTLKRWIKFTE